MTRSLTTAVKNELATNEIRPVHLITIGFGTPVNITDCSFSLTSSVSVVHRSLIMQVILY